MAQTAAEEANSDHVAALLSRVSSKKGVQAAIVIEQHTGAILKTTGDISFSSISANRLSSTSTAAGLDELRENEEKVGGLDDLAAMVWKFIQAAGTLVQSLDPEDEPKLLRLRTKKHELVIVPDSKYLLVVVHETPAA